MYRFLVIIPLFIATFVNAEVKTDTLCADEGNRLLPAEKLSCWLQYCDINSTVNPRVVFYLLHEAEVFYQSNKLEALKHEIDYQWGNYYLAIRNYDSAGFFYNQAMDDFSITDLDFLCRVHTRLSKVFREQGQAFKSAEVIKLADEYAKSSSNKSLQGDVLIEMGIISGEMEFYAEGLVNFQMAIEQFKSQKDTLKMIEVYQKMGMLYEKSGNFPVALDFFEKAKRAYQKLNRSEGIAWIEFLKGNVYQKMGNFDQAAKLTWNAQEYFRKNGNPLQLAHVLGQLGHVYLSNQQYHEASVFLNEAYQLGLKQQEQVLQIELLILLGDLYDQTQQNDKATQNYKMALSIAEALKLNGFRLKLFEKSAAHHMHTGNYKLAYQYQTQQYLLEKNLLTDFYNLKYQKFDEKLNESVQEHETRNMELLNSIMRERQAKQTWKLAFIIALLVSLAGTSSYLISSVRRLRQNKKIIENRQHKINRQRQYLLNLKGQLDLIEKNTNRYFTITTQNIYEPVRTIEYLLNNLDKKVEGLQRTSNGIVDEESLVLSFNLLENLLFWSRNQLEKIEIEAQNVLVNELIDDILRFQRPRTTSKRITVRFHAEQSLAGYFDVKLIEVALRNLIDNAIKFSTNESEIVIRVKLGGAFILITISDVGIGITREQLNRIFSAGKSYESTGTHGEKGGGLGLLLAKTFIERNFGSLSIESSIALGTKVSVLLPLAKN